VIAMPKKKKWKTIASQADLDRVKVGTMIKNKADEQFQVVKVNGIIDGVLQIEARPLSIPMTFAHRDGKWEFA
jgi:hypothetical protein